jgi:hypothetical protein
LDVLTGFHRAHSSTLGVSEMEIINWVMAQAAAKIQKGETILEVKEYAGRYFIKVSFDGPNWEPERNIFIEKWLDLGEYPRD